MSEPRFHDAFTHALNGDDEALAPWWPDRDRGLNGLSVYRNTVSKGVSDALIASYPSVERVVGTEWLREAALVFARAHPPQSAALVTYGQAFPAWLAGFSPAQALPYLPGLAQLDRLWTEAHLAVDAVPLAPERLNTLTPDDGDRLGLRLVPSARLTRFDTGIGDLWQSLRFGEPVDALDLTDWPQSILIWRPFDEVRTQILTPAAVACLDACLSGQSLAQAAALAGTHAAPEDLSLMFADLISTGVFADLTLIEDTQNASHA